MQTVATHDIVDTAIEAGSFKTLLKAAEIAGLVDTLKGQGPFTIFAPTDEAFSQIPKSTLDKILQDQDQLQAILTCHVVPGKMMCSDVSKKKSLKSLEGCNLQVNTQDGCKINDAVVCQADIECSNGVIHVIDTVLMPE